MERGRLGHAPRSCDPSNSKEDEEMASFDHVFLHRFWMSTAVTGWPPGVPAVPSSVRRYYAGQTGQTGQAKAIPWYIRHCQAGIVMGQASLGLAEVVSCCLLNHQSCIHCLVIISLMALGICRCMPLMFMEIWVGYSGDKAVLVLTYCRLISFIDVRLLDLEVNR